MKIGKKRRNELRNICRPMRTQPELHNKPADDATPHWGDVTDVLVLYLTRRNLDS